MLTTKRAARRAALPLAAAMVAAPGATAAPVAPSPTSTPIATAGGASLANAAPTAAALPDLPRSGRMVRVLQRRLTTGGGTAVSVLARSTTVPLRLELRVGRYGRVVDATRVGAGQQFRLSGTASGGDALWLRARRTDGGKERSWTAIGTVRSMRPALASWYGPGLYGQRTACGQTLTTGLKGVAHKSLPCGTRVAIRYRGRTTTAVVVDRGPFSGAREFDLTSATARSIGFGAVGRVWVSHRS